MISKEALRVIDANFNRSREGLRVCEEVARFIWNSRTLTKELKSVRHSISNVLKASPASIKALNWTRDSEHDVGRRVKSGSETGRLTYDDIFSANIQRVKESLRVLEEFFKLIDSGNSARFADLRFKVYGIEKKALK